MVAGTACTTPVHTQASLSLLVEKGIGYTISPLDMELFAVVSCWERERQFL